MQSDGKRAARPPHVLVVEDDAIVSADLTDLLSLHGCQVVGPAFSLATALALVNDGVAIDYAILDAKLGSDMVYPVADLLRGTNVPFLFFTGYDKDAMPERFQKAPLLEKPSSLTDILCFISSMERDD